MLIAAYACSFEGMLREQPAVRQGDVHVTAPLTVMTTVEVPSGIRGSGDAVAASPFVQESTVEASQNLGRAVGLSAGNQHSCAVFDSGKVLCWGSNLLGQLGSDDVALRRGVTLVSGLHDALQVATGGSHSCVVRRKGEVWCWGMNGTGAVGDGSTENRRTPVRVAGLAGVKSIALGEGHSCALKRSGRVVCWGGNHQGQLGDGTHKSKARAVAVKGLKDISSLSAGRSHTCAVTRRGRVMCWGLNNKGQLGDGSVKARRKPVATKGLKNFRTLTLAFDTSCALTATQQLYCWGEGVAGLSGARRPTLQKQGKVLEVALGAVEACVRGKTAAVRCMRAGVSATQVLVDTDTPLIAKRLALGRDHSCALRSTGTILCWGSNKEGQLGTTEAADSPTPIALQLP